MMKKFYEAPVAEELYADAANLMNLLGSTDNDQSGDDIKWEEDLL